MNKFSQKLRIRIGVGLVIFSLLGLVAVIVWNSFGAPKVALIIISIIAFITLAVGVAFIPTIYKDKKEKVFQNKKSKKHKGPFMSEKEWKESEEEDDEMMFIE